MPVGFNSPARNLFLLGSSGAQVVTNFFQQIDQSATTDNFFVPDEIRYNVVDQKYILAGSAEDVNSQGYGWFEKRDESGVGEWGNGIQSFNPADDTTLRSMELDSNNNLIVAGKTGNYPWIGRFTNDGNFDWMSSTYSADVRYLGVTSNGGNYYACGSTPGTGDAQAFIEKFDSSGNPGWGKSAIMIGRDVVLRSVAANSRGHVVSVGYLEDNIYDKGYIVKVDTNTGDVLWDRTLSPDYGGGMIRCMDCYIDVKDQIYVVARDDLSGYLLKYSPEGNMIWQTKTPYDGNTPNITMEFLQVQSDGETEQTVTLGKYYDTTNNDMYGLLSKYSKDGSLVWRRTLKSSNDNSDIFRNVSLDADPSFYYILYTDEEVSIPNGEPDQYTFGKVSTSGNGLGGFQYYDGVSTIDYDILNAPDQISRLSDGSVRNDSTDLLSYPFNANKIVFDDLATQVTNKKRQMDDAGSFEYSGSPAIRPADFQELNLLGSTGFVAETIGSPTILGAQTWSNDLTTANPNNGFEAAGPAVNAFDGGANGGAGAATSTTTIGNQIVWSPSQFPAANGPYTIEVIANANGVIGGWGDRKLIVNGTTVFDPGVDPAPTAPYYITASNLTEITSVIVEAATTARSRLDEIKVNGTELIDGQGITLAGSSTTTTKVKDQSGKGIDGIVNGATHNAAGSGYWEFDGTDDYIDITSIDPIADTSAVTMEAWVFADSLTNLYQVIGTWERETRHWQLTYSGDTNYNLGFAVSGSVDSVGVTSAPATGSWQHIVATWNGGSLSTLSDWAIYVNGVKQTIQFTGPTGTSGTASYIGTRQGFAASNFFDGKIGEVRYYDRALTEAAAFQNYNATKSKYTNTRALTSPFLGTGGRIVVDSDLKLNYDFSVASCIEKSTTVSTTTGEIVIDDATTNGAAYGDAECVATGYGKVVVGARGETNGVYTNGGKAYIYNALTGALEVTLTPSDISGNDWRFGNSVDICGCSGRIAVASSSALYLYDADGTNEVIIDSNSTLPISPPGGGSFGNTVAISGNRVWVSDDNVPTGPNLGGTVYCFNAETGAFLYQLRPNNNLDNFIRYGARIAAGNGKLAVGAESIAHPVTGRSNTGRVYLYDENGRNEKILEPDALTTSSLFGTGGLAIGYGMLVVGASRKQRVENPLELGSGEVYVFDLKGDLKFSIRPSDDPADEDTDAMGFGDSVAVSSDRLIVGAQYYVGNPGGVAGRAYLFEHDGKELQAWTGGGTGANASNFGSSMDASGGTLVIGASAGSPDASGRAYIYPVTGTPTGTIRNLSSTNFYGTINGATFNPAGYFEFDGVDDEIISNDNINQANLPLTYECWVRTANGHSPSDWETLMSTYDPNPEGFWILLNPTNAYVAAGNDGSTYHVTSTAVNDGDWHHVVATLDIPNVRIYVDGVDVGGLNNAPNNIIPSTRFVRIGSMSISGSSDRFFDGDIGEARIYHNRALTATEVSQNYNATRGKYGV